jgi:hypothetical protein
MPNSIQFIHKLSGARHLVKLSVITVKVEAKREKDLIHSSEVEASEKLKRCFDFVYC